MRELWKRPWAGIRRSISATTRPPRPGERQGRDYFFLSRSQFEQSIRRGAFLEQARILKHRYGTPRRPIEQALRLGQDVLLCIDVQGARQIRRSGLPVTTIFLMPPSRKALAQRLHRRGTETEAQIQARLRLARKELQEMRRYDYAVVNDRLSEAVSAIRGIISAERFRVERGERRK